MSICVLQVGLYMLHLYVGMYVCVYVCVYVFVPKKKKRVSYFQHMDHLR